MQHRLALWVGVISAAAALSSACGSKSSLGNQLSPSGSTTLTSLTLTLNPPSIGSTTQATATATFSNGSTSPVASGFGTDTPSVATVNSTGGVTGVSVGDVTIFVDYQGMRATKKIRVLPGFGGIFFGSYTIAGCAATGEFINTDPAQNFCSVFAIGQTPGIAFNNTQSADLTSMTGLFILGGLQGGTGTGAISPSGTWTFTGSIVFTTGRVEFQNFTATSPAMNKIAGSFTLFFTDTTLTGSGTVTATNLDMTRQSAGAAMSTNSMPLSNGSDWRSLVLRGIRPK